MHNSKRFRFTVVSTIPYSFVILYLYSVSDSSHLILVCHRTIRQTGLYLLVLHPDDKTSLRMRIFRTTNPSA